MRRPDDDETGHTAETKLGTAAFAATTPLGDVTILSRPDDAAIVPPTTLPEPTPDQQALDARYELRGLLGAGGMGEVRASRDQWIGREVALKTLHADVGLKPGARERFLREIRVQGQLEHPAIVPVYELGATADAELWFTMRRVRGLTLASVLERLASGDEEAERRFNRRRLLTAFTTVCMAVDYAHSRGVVHRDLKPANVMLGEFGEVYVLDWGIAKLVGATEPDAAVEVGDEQTGEGRIIGTLGYMPPEQARGAKVDARSDVYSLGVVLFELLALRHLVRESSALKALELVMEGIVAKPSEAAPDRDIPPELDAICLRATAKDPSQRFASARQLSEAVERYLDGDRDLERRRTMADAFATEAKQRWSEGAEKDAEAAHGARMEAARDVLRALALDPDNGDAQRTLGRVLLEPPRDLPASAAREHADQRGEERAEGARLGFRAFVSYLLAFPVMVLAGIRSPAMVLAGLFATLAAMLVAKRVQGKRMTGASGFYVLLGLSIAIVALQSTWLGPFVLTPVAATITVSVFALYAERHERKSVVVAGLLMVSLPFLAELVPGLPHAVEFDAGTIVLHPRSLELPKIATTFGLVYTTLGFVLLPTLFLFRLRDALRVAEERTFLQAWTLRQLFPKATGSVTRSS